MMSRITSAPARRLAHPLDEVLVAVVDGDLGAEFGAQVEFVRRPGGDRHPDCRARVPPGCRACRCRWRRRGSAAAGRPTDARSSPGSTTPCTPPRADAAAWCSATVREPASPDRRGRRRTRRNRRLPAKRRLVARSAHRLTPSPTSAMVPDTSRPRVSAGARRGRIVRPRPAASRRG